MAGQRDDEGDDVLLWCFDPESVEAEKAVHGQEGDPLVSIHKRVLAGDAESIGRRKVRQIDAWLVFKPISGTLRCG